MKTAVVAGVVLLAAAAAYVTLIEVSPDRGAGAGSNAGASPNRTASELETIRGEVIGLPSGGRGGGDGKGRGAGGSTAPLITVRTANETIEVHAGPPRFHNQIGLSLAKSDEIEVTGRRTGPPGKAILVAQTIKNGDRIFTIRGEDGQKLWQPTQKSSLELSTVAGEVVSLAPEVTDGSPNREGSGMMIALETGDGRLVVQLGPQSFRTKEGLVLGVGDRIEISGWRLPGATVVDTPVMLAGTIKKGNQSLRVRDDERGALWPTK